jgi:hypothetical protein
MQVNAPSRESAAIATRSRSSRAITSHTLVPVWLLRPYPKGLGARGRTKKRWPHEAALSSGFFIDREQRAASAAGLRKPLNP